MSRQNKVNPDHYTTAGRLSPDDLARERWKKQTDANHGGFRRRANKPLPPWMTTDAAGRLTMAGAAETGEPDQETLAATGSPATSPAGEGAKVSRRPATRKPPVRKATTKRASPKRQVTTRSGAKAVTKSKQTTGAAAKRRGAAAKRASGAAAGRRAAKKPAARRSAKPRRAAKSRRR